MGESDLSENDSSSIEDVTERDETETSQEITRQGIQNHRDSQDVTLEDEEDEEADETQNTAELEGLFDKANQSDEQYFKEIEDKEFAWLSKNANSFEDIDSGTW